MYVVMLVSYEKDMYNKYYENNDQLIFMSEDFLSALKRCNKLKDYLTDYERYSTEWTKQFHWDKKYMFQIDKSVKNVEVRMNIGSDNSKVVDVLHRDKDGKVDKRMRLSMFKVDVF